MEIKYTPSESTVKQPEIEVGITTVYFRRNFKQIERTRMEGETPELLWSYEEAAMSKDEALHVLAEQQATHTKELADADGINVDHEFRLTLLELGLTDLDI